MKKYRCIYCWKPFAKKSDLNLSIIFTEFKNQLVCNECFEDEKELGEDMREERIDEQWMLLEDGTSIPMTQWKELNEVEL